MINTVTFAQASEFILTLTAIISGVWGVVKIVLAVIARAKRPNEEQDARLVALERKVAEHDEYFRSDKLRIERLEEATEIILKNVSALTAHALDGNNIEELEACRKDATNFLLAQVKR